MINLRYILKPSKEAFDGFAIWNKFTVWLWIHLVLKMVVILEFYNFKIEIIIFIFVRVPVLKTYSVSPRKVI